MKRSALVFASALCLTASAFAQDKAPVPGQSAPQAAAPTSSPDATCRRDGSDKGLQEPELGRFVAICVKAKTAE